MSDPMGECLDYLEHYIVWLGCRLDLSKPNLPIHICIDMTMPGLL